MVVVLHGRQVVVRRGRRVRVRREVRRVPLAHERQQVAQQVDGLRDGLGLLLGGQRAAHGGLGQQLLGGEARLVGRGRGALAAHVVVQ